MESWSPSSWQSKEILQQPEYENNEALQEVLQKVHALPPIVHYQEVDALKRELAKAGRGESFLLQVCPFLVFLNSKGWRLCRTFSRLYQRCH